MATLVAIFSVAAITQSCFRRRLSIFVHRHPRLGKGGFHPLGETLLREIPPVNALYARSGEARVEFWSETNVRDFHDQNCHRNHGQSGFETNSAGRRQNCPVRSGCRCLDPGHRDYCCFLIWCQSRFLRCRETTSPCVADRDPGRTDFSPAV